MSDPSSRASLRDGRATAAFAMATRVSATLVSFLAAALAVTLLSPSRIGFFLSFAGLAAFSSISDLGLNYSVLLAAATRPADDPAPVREAALAALAPTVALTLTAQLAAGFFVLVRKADLSWPPWFVYCVLACAFQLLYLFVIIVEGTNRRRAAWRANFILEALAGGALLLAIALGQELWGFAAGMAVRCLLVAMLFRNEFIDHWRRRSAWDYRRSLRLWRVQLLPMQWKTALNMLAGLVTTRLLTPILLITNGAPAAGRIGLGLSLTSAIVAATSAWPQSQNALYVQMYHEGRRSDLLRRFRRTCALSLGLCIATSVLAGVAVACLRAISAHLADRLPSSSLLAPLLLAAPFTHLSYCLAILIRSQRDDPALIANMVFGALLLCGLWWAATIGAQFLCVTVLIGAIAGLSLYGWFYERWRGSMLLDR